VSGVREAHVRTKEGGIFTRKGSKAYNAYAENIQKEMSPDQMFKKIELNILGKWGRILIYLDITVEIVNPTS